MFPFDETTRTTPPHDVRESGDAWDRDALRGALREAEVAEGERTETLERLVRCRRPRPDIGEERAQIVAKPGHSAIVR